MTRAIGALPVPLSPLISTVARLLVTLPISFTSTCITRLVPTMSPSRAARLHAHAGGAARQLPVLERAVHHQVQRGHVREGLVDVVEEAPAFMARMVVSMSW